MSNQTLHDVVIAPGRRREQWGLSFPVLDIHVAANFTEGFGHRVVAVPGSTVQGGFFFLVKGMDAGEDYANGSQVRDCSQCGKKINLK